MCAALFLMMSINIVASRLMRMFQEVHSLFNTALNNTPNDRQYLELNYSTLYKATYERQAHWVLKMQVAWRAGQRTALHEKA
jgi:hypothetical protein